MATKKKDFGPGRNEEKALEATLAKIRKDYGDASVMKLGDEAIHEVEAFPTGSLAVDIALGVGGLPEGRIIEIYGPESSGKTTLALHAIASAQKGKIAAFIDAEHALDPRYARNLGVNPDELYVAQPDFGEQALSIAIDLIHSNAVGIIVIDSVAALVPKAEIEGEMTDSSVGVQARMMSKALRKIAGAANSANCTVIFINQLREKIGVMFGSPETTTGGKALKFYASVRLDIRRTGQIKEGTDIIGNETRVKVVKNKVAPPFTQAETAIYYNKGFSRESDIIELGVDYGVIRKSGSWYNYNADQLGQGKEKARVFLEDNPALADEIETLIRQKAGILPTTEEGSETAAEESGYDNDEA